MPGEPLLPPGGGGPAAAGQDPGRPLGHVPGGGDCGGLAGPLRLRDLCRLPRLRGAGLLQKRGRPLPPGPEAPGAGPHLRPRGGRPLGGPAPGRGRGLGGLPIQERPPGRGALPGGGHVPHRGQPVPGIGECPAAQRAGGALLGLGVRLCLRRAVRRGVLPVRGAAPPGAGGGPAAVPLPGRGGAAAGLPKAVPRREGAGGVRPLVPAGGGQNHGGPVPGGVLPAVPHPQGGAGVLPPAGAGEHGARPPAAGAVRRSGGGARWGINA